MCVCVATNDVFCRDKCMLVATKVCLCLSKQNIHASVATKLLFETSQNFCRDKHTFVPTKHAFVATKMILEAVPASDN